MLPAFYFVRESALRKLPISNLVSFYLAPGELAAFAAGCKLPLSLLHLCLLSSYPRILAASSKCKAVLPLGSKARKSR
jgi:hypothetical protein